MKAVGCLQCISYIYSFLCTILNSLSQICTHWHRPSCWTQRKTCFVRNKTCIGIDFLVAEASINSQFPVDPQEECAGEESSPSWWCLSSGAMGKRGTKPNPWTSTSVEVEVQKCIAQTFREHRLPKHSTYVLTWWLPFHTWTIIRKEFDLWNGMRVLCGGGLQLRARLLEF